MRVIDIHTHAFADDVAVRAMPALERGAKIKPSFDGTDAGLHIEYLHEFPFTYSIRATKPA